MVHPGGRPLRVVHVIGGLELGGAETLLYRLATHCIPGIEQEVICLGRPDWYSSRLEEHGITVHHLGMSSPLKTLAGIGRLGDLLRSRDVDVVQSWMYFANMLSALVARRSGTPVVWGIHNSSFERVGLASRLCAYAGGANAKRFTSFVVNCSRHSSELHKKLGYSAAPNTVVPNGYDPLEFRPDEPARRKARRSLGVDDQVFVIGCVARWHPHKDIPSLLKALRIAADEGAPLRCLLVGRGLDEANRQLAAEIIKAGCGSLVTLLGTRNDVPDLARAFDIQVLSSRSEAFPNVIAETMLSGTPNVVTDVGDSAFMVGDTGWVVPARDPARLAGAIVDAWRECSRQPDGWRARRRRARERIARHFTFEKMADAYALIWREVAITSDSRRCTHAQD
ncbi:MAG: glycosyltransferase [Sphingomicrobium sp.]